MGMEGKSMKNQWFMNGKIVLENRILNQGYIQVVDGTIAGLGEGFPPISAEDWTVDVEGRWIVPGFIDVHVHGGAGCNFMSEQADELDQITQFHAQHGTTCLLATTVTAEASRLTAAIQRLAGYIQSGRLAGSRMEGIHIEGPFISPLRKGAQDAQYILDPDLSLLETWLENAAGTIRLMTVAPERPGALELIRTLVRSGVTVGVGHTDANYVEALEGIRSGITHSIHTFNGMRPLHHRDPGILGVVLSDERVKCEIICDGHHVHPGAIELMYRAKGPHGIVLISDAIEAAGLPDGDYTLDTQAVRLQDGKVNLLDGQTLAGSVLTMDQAYRHILSYLPITMVEASLMASTNPAESIGIGHKKGKIRVGMDADIVVLDQGLKVIRTVVEGRTVFTTGK